MNVQNCALVALMTLSLSACSSGMGGKEVKGSGTVISDKRAPAGDFQQVRLSLPADCKVLCGSAASVTISGDDNIVPLVQSNVENGVLTISLDKTGGRIKPSRELSILVTTPQVKEVDLAGAGDVEVTGVKEDVFQLTVSGAGNATVAGEAKSVVLNITGAGDGRLGKLKTDNAKVTITGAGSVVVDAAQSLDASITGSGSIKATGHPKKVTKSITGAGSVTMTD